MRRRGFTLLEVLVAVGVVLVLSWGVFGVMSGLQERRNRLVELAARQQQVGTLMDLLEADLVCAVASDRAGGGGVVGSSTAVKVASRGVVFPGPGPGGGGRGDLLRSDYRFDVAAGTVTLARDGGGVETLVEGVRRLELRYLDDGAWGPEFDSEVKEGLPRAVEVAIWFGQEAGVELKGTRPDRVRRIAIPDGGRGEEAE